jgi:hypothetical protein
MNYTETTNILYLRGRKWRQKGIELNENRKIVCNQTLTPHPSRRCYRIPVVPASHCQSSNLHDP